MDATLTMTAAQHEALRRHLLPGDGLAAVALALCGRRAGPALHRLLVHEVHEVPYSICERSADRVTWRTTQLKPLLDKAAKRGLALLKIHSHPSGFPRFSATDDAADAILFPAVHGWIDGEEPHASAVMMPNGRIFGRVHHADGAVANLAAVTVVGDDIKIWRTDDAGGGDALPEFALRHIQTFGEGTFHALRHLRIAVVGCSGTGSLVVDMLARLGVGALLLLDPERVEEKNLNRIVNALERHLGWHKVDVMREFVQGLGTGTCVETFATDLLDPKAVRAVADCDLVFGCMDSVDGRHLLNRISTFYLQPYFDVGVRLDADGKGGIEQICGGVHYLQPGRSSLLSRGVYTLEQVRAEALRRVDPERYAELLKEKYIRGVRADRPAVNAVNMVFAGQAVMELLLRLHPCRIETNADYARHTMSLTAGVWLNFSEGADDEALARHAGRGDIVPLLELPALDFKDRAA